MLKCNFLFIIFLFTISKTNGQVQEPKQASKLLLDDFSYPLFLGNETHSSLNLSYQLSDNLEVEFQNYYDTYILGNRYRSSLGLKLYVSPKLFIFGGVEAEFKRDKITGQLESNPRISINSGLGYDVKEHFSLRMKSNTSLTKNTFGAFGEQFIPMPQIYSLGGKVKF